MDIEKIDLNEYEFIAPSEIEIIDIPETKFIDITVEYDNSFFIKLKNSDKMVLSHNCDGTSIAMLLINLFYTYWPDLFKYGVIKLVKSPLIEAKKNGSKEIVKFYSEDEYKLVENNYNVIKFNKGLGSLSKATYKEMIMNPKLITFKADENTENILEMLFGKSNQDRRKEWISGV